MLSYVRARQKNRTGQQYKQVYNYEKISIPVIVQEEFVGKVQNKG